MRKYLFVIIGVFIFSVCTANTIIVPDDYSTIQTAIDSASAGDSVLVKSGQYNEDISIQKNIVLKKYGVNIPVIKGAGVNTRAVFIQADVTFEGFKVISSDSTRKGISCRASSSEISIRDCIVDSASIGIYNEDAKLSINDCEIQNCYDYGLKLTWGLVDSIRNDAESGVNNCNIHDNSSGIMIRQGHKSDSELKICNSKIMNNEHKGVYCGITTDPVFEENLIYNNGSNNYDCGIYVNQAYPDIINNTLYGNNYGLVIYSSSDVEVVNTIIWNSDQASVNGSSGNISITYSCIEDGWSGTGNIDTDPLFIDPRDDDFGLQWNSTNFSPCIDTGDPDMDWDSDDTPPDMGAITAVSHSYFHNQYDSLIIDNAEWISFPALNTITDSATEALYVLENQELIDDDQIQTDDILDHVEYEEAEVIYFNNGWYNILSPDGDFHSYQGYKIQLQEGISSATIGITGKWEDESEPIALDVNKDNWIGCYLEEPANFRDAFSSIWDEWESVYSEHWAVSRPEPGVTPTAVDTLTANPGELYIITVYEDCQLIWNKSSPSPPPRTKQMTDYFTYDKKLDYMPVNVDTVYGDMPQELAVYSGDECLGASKVNGSYPVQILAYPPDAGTKNGNLDFMLYYGSKEKAKAVTDYMVYEHKVSAYVNRDISFDKEAYVTVRLNTKETKPEFSFGLLNNYPNPVNSDLTHISFAPTKDAEETEIKIYNLRGQLIRKLDCSKAKYNKAGIPTVSWDCKDSRGRKVQSGVYFYKLISGKKQAVKKMVIVK